MRRLLDILLIGLRWFCGLLWASLAAVCAVVVAVPAYVLPRVRQGIKVRSALTALLLAVLASTAWSGAFAQNPYTTGLVLDLDANAGVWKDAGKTTAATSAGDLVYTWADQSGAGNDVLQATRGAFYQVKQSGQ